MFGATSSPPSETHRKPAGGLLGTPAEPVGSQWQGSASSGVVWSTQSYPPLGHAKPWDADTDMATLTHDAQAHPPTRNTYGWMHVHTTHQQKTGLPSESQSNAQAVRQLLRQVHGVGPWGHRTGAEGCRRTPRATALSQPSAAGWTHGRREEGLWKR